MDKRIEELIEIEYLSNAEENDCAKQFERDYMNQLSYLRERLSYDLLEIFDDLMAYRSKYFKGLKKEIFKQGFFLGLKAKIPDDNK